MTLRTIGSPTPAPPTPAWSDTLPAPTEPLTHVHTNARGAVLRFVVVVALVSAAAIATAALTPTGQWPALCASPTR